MLGHQNDEQCMYPIIEVGAIERMYPVEGHELVWGYPNSGELSKFNVRS